MAAERGAGGKAEFLSPQGPSQIEVAFEIMDKGIGKSEKVTTNDRSRPRRSRLSFLSSLLEGSGDWGASRGSKLRR